MATELQRAPRAIPVIALTALVMKGDEERIRAAGYDGYIAKPIRCKKFLATIAALRPHHEPQTRHLRTPCTHSDRGR